MPKKIEWVEIARRGRNHAVLCMDIIAPAYREGVVRRVGGFSFNQETYRQFNGARWVDQRDLDKYKREVRRREAQHPGWLVGLARRYERLIRRFRPFADRHSRVNWKQATNGQLLRVFEGFSYALSNTVAYLYMYIYLNRFLSDEFSSTVAAKAKDPNRQQEYFRTLFALDRISETRAERLAMLRLAVRVAKRQSLIRSASSRRRLRELVRRFSHLNRYVMYGRSYTVADFQKRVVHLARQDPQGNLREFRKEIALGRQLDAVMRELALPNSVRWKIRGARAWMTAAQEWDESFTYLMHKLQPFWDEVAKRLGVRYGELIEMLSDEVREHLRGGRRISAALRRTARERYRDSATIFANGQVTTIWGKALKEYYRKEAKAEVTFRHIKELKGMPASPGHVRGRVAVTYSVTEIGKVKKGDVLVAAGTTPSHVPAMERAVAIVTDEGGLLCHAAIVSRELKIPCVVGTKIATKVLRDGDVVEVDAVKGVVRIAKRVR